MGLFKSFWEEFIAAFRAERRGGEVAAESRRRTEELRRQLKEEKEALRIAKLMVRAKTPKEKETVRGEIIKHVLTGTGGEAALHRSSDAAELPRELRWSANPGGHEAHLIRRHSNPYFAISRRTVTTGELEEAKAKDREDYLLCQQQLAQLMNEVEASVASAPTITVGELHPIRERLDELIFFSMGAGGPAKEIASKADRLREVVIASLRSAFSNDPLALEAVERADRYHKESTRRYYIPVMAQMLRKNSPIPKEESISAVLSEDPETISLVMGCFAEDVQAPMRIAALQIMRQALDEGFRDPRFEAKIFAVGG